MYKTVKDEDIRYILDNLRSEDETELKELYGDDWKKTAFDILSGRKFRVLFGFDDNNIKVPVAMGAIENVCDETPNIACVWLLTTKYIIGHKTSLTKVLKEEFFSAEKKYDYLYNFIYKSNKKAKNWLEKFGFRFETPVGMKVPENFEFFYKVINRKG